MGTSFQAAVAPQRVKVFLSYSSADRPVAERIQFALLALGWDVFFDRADLEAGLEYDQAIARAVDASDVFVFLITPESVTSGRYTLTELGLAERKWPHPRGRVLPVMLRPTAIETIPAYLRAVNFLTPVGDVVAETADATRRLARALPFATRVRRRLRTRGGIAGLASVTVLATAVWIVSANDALRGRVSAMMGDTAASRTPIVSPLPDNVRRRARAVGPMADGGFVIAVASPSQLVRFSPAGTPVGEPLALTGVPVSIARTPTQLMVVTRTPDGVSVFDWKDLRVIDTIRLEPARVRFPRELTSRPRLSGDIQSAAIGSRGMLWAVTGERDGDPAVLRFRSVEREWELPTWVAKPEGIVGGEARGLALRTVNGELWAVTAGTSPSSLYRLAYPNTIDEHGGHASRMVSCAHDLTASAAGNLLLLSCENELQEVRDEGGDLRLLGVRPTLPSESAQGNWTYERIISDAATAVVALNTEVGQPNNRPGRARVAEVDSAGAVRTLLDTRDAVVTSMAVTPRWLVAVLRRADGTTDVVKVGRRE